MPAHSSYTAVSAAQIIDATDSAKGLLTTLPAGAANGSVVLMDNAATATVKTGTDFNDTIATAEIERGVVINATG